MIRESALADRINTRKNNLNWNRTCLFSENLDYQQLNEIFACPSFEDMGCTLIDIYPLFLCMTPSRQVSLMGCTPTVGKSQSTNR